MIAPMAKVHVAISRRRAKQLLTWLQEEEVLHVAELDEAREAPATSSDLDYELANVQFALEFLERIRSELSLTRKISWRDRLAGKPEVTIAKLEQTLHGLQLPKLIQRIREASDQLAQLQAKKTAAEEAGQALAPWSMLKITGADLEGTKHAKHFLLNFSLVEEVLVKRRLMAVPTLAWQEVKRVATTKKNGSIYGEVVVAAAYAHKVREIVEQTNAREVVLEVPAGETIGEQAVQIDKEIKAIEHTYLATIKKAGEILKIETALQFAYDALLHKQERQAAKKKAAHLPHVVVFSGWIPRHRLVSLQAKLLSEVPTAALEEVEWGKEETPPTQFFNNRLTEPFEAVTDIFGKPKYTELDPTGPMSLFFLIAFGLALTDAGYGLVMMGVTFWAQKYLQLGREVKKMMRLLFYAGASTTVFGALTGGWFGIDLSARTGELAQILLSLRVLDPVGEPMSLLLVALVIGVVQLIFAWMVRGYYHFKRQEYREVFLDDLPWITIVPLVLAWGLAARGVVLTELASVLKLLAIINAGVLVVTQGRSYKNPLLKVGAGLLSLYGLVSFLSDTLSYSRLLALGLATGIIALVVNLLGEMVAVVPGIGWLLAVVVLVVGHIFNLGINALGAFIHSGRLQFVEFFPKFIEGGGRAYRPLGRVGKYVVSPAKTRQESQTV